MIHVTCGASATTTMIPIATVFRSAPVLRIIVVAFLLCVLFIELPSSSIQPRLLFTPTSAFVVAHRRTNRVTFVLTPNNHSHRNTNNQQSHPLALVRIESSNHRLSLPKRNNDQYCYHNTGYHPMHPPPRQTPTRRNTITALRTSSSRTPTEPTPLSSPISNTATLSMKDLYTNVAVVDPKWFQDYIVPLVVGGDEEEEDEIINADFWSRVKELRHFNTNDTLPNRSHHHENHHMDRSAPVIRQPSSSSSSSSFSNDTSTVDDANHTAVTAIRNSMTPPSTSVIIRAEETNETSILVPSSSVKSTWDHSAVVHVNTSDATNVASTLTTTAHTDENVTLLHVTPVDFPSTIPAPVNETNQQVRTVDDVDDDAVTVGRDHYAPSLPPTPRVVLYTYNDDDDDDTDDEEESSLSWKQAPFSILHELGYTEADVVSLLPMALHIIVTDQIRKPHRPVGIPSRWLRKNSGSTFGDDEEVPDNMIRIVNSSLVDEICQVTTKTVVSNAKQNRPPEPQSPVQVTPLPNQRNTTSVLSDASHSQDIDENDVTNQPSNHRTTQNVTVATADSVVPPTQRTFIAGAEAVESSQRSKNDVEEVFNRARSTKKAPTTTRVLDSRSPRPVTNPNMNNKTVPLPSSSERRRRRPPDTPSPPKERAVYSGRSTTTSRTKRRDTQWSDLPSSSSGPPKSGIWPDVDTFQKLLRDEATFRLRILGNDWSDIVKEEIDWRNDLYTNWLHTLQNGIGEPFVQSRSDRLRRQRRQQQEQMRRDEKDAATPKRPK